MPATRIKGADEATLRVWTRQLQLPMKVHAKVSNWVHNVLTRPERKRPAITVRQEGLAKFQCKHSLEEHGQGEATQGDVGVAEDWGPKKEDTQGAQKVAKHDNAEVPVYLWNDRARADSLLTPSDEDLDCIRVCTLRYWKRLVVRTFECHCRIWREDAKWTGQLEYYRHQDRQGLVALSRAANSTWWE
jgi:hypothetical protein